MFDVFCFGKQCLLLFFRPIIALGSHETTFHEQNNKHDYEQCFIRLLFLCAHDEENSKCNNKVIPL